VVTIRGVALVFLALGVTGADAAARELKGDGPTTIAAAYGSVWVGTGRGEVLSLDLRTGRVRRTFARDSSPSFVSDLMPGYGFLWLADSYRPVARLDPSRGRIEEVRALRDITPGPGPVAAGAGSVWSGDWRHRRVFRIAPRSGKVVRSARWPGGIVDLAAGRPGAYAVYAPRGPGGPRILRRVDPTTARPEGRAATFRCDIGLTIGADAVWTIDYCTWKLARRDPRTLRVRAERPVPQLTMKVVLAHGSVWLVGDSGRVVRLDARSLRTTAQLWVRAAAVAATSDALWLLDVGDGRTGIVRRLDPRTNRIVAAVRVR
jgi:outer membrane protein assembly factor BamB